MLMMDRITAISLEGGRHVLHFDMARHAYCRDMAELPAAARAFYEPLWRTLEGKRPPRLGGFPAAYADAFSPGEHVIVIQLPSSDLMSWMFGDVDDLIVLMTCDQMVAGRFEEAHFDVTN